MLVRFGVFSLQTRVSSLISCSPTTHVTSTLLTLRFSLLPLPPLFHLLTSSTSLHLPRLPFVLLLSSSSGCFIMQISVGSDHLIKLRCASLCTHIRARKHVCAAACFRTDRNCWWLCGIVISILDSGSYTHKHTHTRTYTHRIQAAEESLWVRIDKQTWIAGSLQAISLQLASQTIRPSAAQLLKPARFCGCSKWSLWGRGNDKTEHRGQKLI